MFCPQGAYGIPDGKGIDDVCILGHFWIRDLDMSGRFSKFAVQFREEDSLGSQKR